MKYPETKKAYCPKCKKHTVHSVSIYKKSPQREVAQGARRYNRKKRGYGSQPKPIARKTAKLNKRTTPLLKCKDCNYKYYGKSMRLKKFELTRVTN